MPSPIWRGSAALTQDDTSPELVTDSGGERLTLTYSGPYDTCRSSRPGIGDAIEGWDGLLVETHTLRRAPGGRGLLTVVARKPTPDSEAETSGYSQEYEIDWARTDMPLATHKRYKDALTVGQLEEIEFWLNNPSQIPNRLEGKPAKQVELYKKRLRGQDSYMLFTPVIRRITPNSTRPTTSAAGKIDTPPIAIAGFDYVKTADSARRQEGRWNRTEEWTGSYFADPDIYGPEPAP